MQRAPAALGCHIFQAVIRCASGMHVRIFLYEELFLIGCTRVLRIYGRCG
jgi:hypothetical protein